MTVSTLDQARAVIRRNANSSLTGTPEHLAACAFLDGWAVVPLVWTVDPEQWAAWVMGRAEWEARHG